MCNLIITGTTDVTFHKYKFQQKDGQDIYLIDTPGFDDTNVESTEVFKKIASFLCTHCNGKGRIFAIGGMIYVHRITDIRMSGSSLKCLRIFEKICGEECFPNVTIVTTMWGLLKNDDAIEAAETREGSLKERPEFFGTLMRGRARMKRYYGDESGAMQIVDALPLRQGGLLLLLQSEMMSSETTKLEETSAGRYLEGELNETRKRYEIQRKQLEETAEELREDKELMHEFSEQIRNYAVAVDRLNADRGGLSVTLKDMQNEQAAIYARMIDGSPKDITAKEHAKRISLLEQQFDVLKKLNEEQLEKAVRLEGRNKELEAIQKRKEDQGQRKQTAKEKVQEKQSNSPQFMQKMNAFFRSIPREPGQIPRRAETMPLDSRNSSKQAAKPKRKKSRSKSRKSGKPSEKYRTLQEQGEQDIQSSQDFQPEEGDPSESEEYSDNDYPVSPVVQAHPISYFAPTPGNSNTTYTYPPPVPPIVDPFGLPRSIPHPLSLPRRHQISTYSQLRPPQPRSQSFQGNMHE